MNDPIHHKQPEQHSTSACCLQQPNLQPLLQHQVADLKIQGKPHTGLCKNLSLVHLCHKALSGWLPFASLFFPQVFVSETP